jgi:predicted ribonuclease YlaK
MLGYNLVIAVLHRNPNINKGIFKGKRSPDNMILTITLKLKNEIPILLTSDNGLQVKAKGLGISTITLKEVWTCLPQNCQC